MDPSLVETKIPEHAYLGYWLQEPESEGEAWKIEPFAATRFYGSPITTGAEISALQGAASYSGAAAGIYAVPEEGVTGQFHADVTLTARWGQRSPDEFSLQEAWRIHGTIDKFQSLTAEQHHLYIWDWSLTLGPADMTPTRDSSHNPSPDNSSVDLDGGTQPGVTTGSGAGAGQGAWTARFWGQDPTAPDPRTNEPKAVTGEFTGHFADDSSSGKAHAAGSVAGAFVAGQN